MKQASISSIIMLIALFTIIPKTDNQKLKPPSGGPDPPLTELIISMTPETYTIDKWGLGPEHEKKNWYLQKAKIVKLLKKGKLQIKADNMTVDTIVDLYDKEFKKLSSPITDFKENINAGKIKIQNVKIILYDSGKQWGSLDLAAKYTSPQIGYHEMLVICAKNGDKDEYLYFFVERGTYLYPGTTDDNDYNYTDIRLLYLGQTDKGCSGHKTRGDTLYPDHMNYYNLWDKTKQELKGDLYTLTKETMEGIEISHKPKEDQVKLKNFFNLLIKYGIKYPRFWYTTISCQHFATGIYNYLTGERIETINYNDISPYGFTPILDFTDMTPLTLEQTIPPPAYVRPAISANIKFNVSPSSKLKKINASLLRK